MNWNGYTVFSVLSGAVIVLGALGARGLSGKDRLYGFIAGAFFLGYGLFAANQTSGTFVFPVWIFIIPPAAVVYFVASTVSKSRPSGPAKGGKPSGAAAVPGKGGVGAPASPLESRPGSASPQVRPAPADRPAVWAPPPPPPGSSEHPGSAPTGT